MNHTVFMMADTIMLAQVVVTRFLDMGASNVKIMRGNEVFLLQDANPLKGELYYAVDTQRYYMWSGSAWMCLGTLDESSNQTPHPINCTNCGAVLNSYPHTHILGCE